MAAHAKEIKMPQDQLFNRINISDTNEKEISITLEQYKLYVEMADRVSNRRSTLNNFYLTLNTAIIALLGTALTNTSKNLGITISIISFFICVLWSQKIDSYKNLNKIKFGIINKIEENLPIMPYKHEWQQLNSEKNKKTYFQITDLEKNIPYIFIFSYLGLFIFLILN